MLLLLIYTEISIPESTQNLQYHTKQEHTSFE